MTMFIARRLVALSSSLLLGILLAGTAAAAQDGPAVSAGKRSANLKDIVELAEFIGLSVSGAGTHAAYTVIRANVDLNAYVGELYIASVTGEKPPYQVHRFTSDNEGGAPFGSGSGHKWSLDGRWLAFLRESTQGVELCIVHATGADMRCLSSFGREVSLEGWWPNGSSIVLSEETIEEDIRSDIIEGDPAVRYDGSWRVSTATPWKTPSVQISHSKYWSVSLDGEKRPLSDIEEQQWRGRSPHELKLDNSGSLFRPFVRGASRSPNGRLDAFIIDDVVRETSTLPPRYRSRSLIVRDVLSGEAQNLMASPYFSPIENPYWLRDSAHLRILEQRLDRSIIYDVNRRTGRSREVLSVPDHLSQLSWSSDAGMFIAVAESPVKPPRLVSVNVRTRKVDVLHHPNAEFESIEVPPSYFISVKTSFGLEHSVQITLPTGYVRGRKYPLVATTYSASNKFLRGAAGNEYPILGYASHGFVVASLRISPDLMGTSERRNLDVSLVRLRSPLEALETVIQDLVEEGLVDEHRCGITGLSYGSEIVDWAMWNSKIFSAAAASTGGMSPSQFFMLEDVWRDGFLALRGLPFPNDESRVAWKQYSAALNANQVRTPLLLQPPDEEALAVLELYLSLKYARVPVEMHVFPNEGHTKRAPRSRYWASRRNVDWMRFWLKGEEDSDPALATQYARWRELREGWAGRMRPPG